jgi:uncharacterized repeat protein (TIGR04138 family)
MSFRDELARIIAGDSRYAIEAYIFILEALNSARREKLRGRRREQQQAERSTKPVAGSRSSRSQPKKSGVSGHVTAAELCAAVQALALRQFGSLAATVLCHWGVTSTSNIGDIVYNLISAGDLEKTSSDSRSDFDDVFEFETALKSKCMLATNDAD